jgi:hypothetical protein
MADRTKENRGLSEKSYRIEFRAREQKARQKAQRLSHEQQSVSHVLFVSKNKFLANAITVIFVINRVLIGL